MPDSVFLLEADPQLAARLPGPEGATARTASVVAAIDVQPGDWRPPVDRDRRDGLVGLLVLSGLVARHVEIDAIRFTELIGPADLLRPWQGPAPDSSFGRATGWQILDEARLAILDEQLLGRLGRWPSVIDALIGRAIQRTRSLAFHLGVCYMPRVDLRLLLVLWHFADRWGQQRRDGVLLPLPLGHDLLARVVSARRGTVTTTLGDLQRTGKVERVDRGWLLRGEPPEQLHDLRSQTTS